MNGDSLLKYHATTKPDTLLDQAIVQILGRTISCPTITS